MPNSPNSSRLETPASNRSSRVRKPVKHYGSFVDSDLITDENTHHRVQDDDDESFELKGAKEESDERVDYDGSNDDTNLVIRFFPSEGGKLRRRLRARRQFRKNRGAKDSQEIKTRRW